MLKTWETKAILLETKDVATYFGVKLQDICDPFRWAICGQQNGPDLFEIAEYLGKEEVLFRLRRSFLPNYYKGIEKDLKLLVDKQRNRSEAHAD
jgi:glutamyl/glutaminyl-tRNA synthetase